MEGIRSDLVSWWMTCLKRGFNPDIEQAASAERTCHMNVTRISQTRNQWIPSPARNARGPITTILRENVKEAIRASVSKKVLLQSVQVFSFCVFNFYTVCCMYAVFHFKLKHLQCYRLISSTTSWHKRSHSALHERKSPIGQERTTK